MGLGPILMTSFNLDYLLRAPSPDNITWGLGLQHTNINLGTFTAAQGFLKSQRAIVTL